MSLEFRVSIEGAEDVEKLLRDEIPKIVASHGMLRAAEAASRVIEIELYARTPERDEGDRDEEQPHLRDSMTTAITLDSRHRGVTVDIGFGKVGYIAHFVEYGHRMIGHKPDKKMLGTVEQKPFMRPAAAAAAQPAIDLFGETLMEHLRAAGVAE